MQYKHLSIEEREKIQELLWQKKSIRHIALSLNRSASSISRELKKKNSVISLTKPSTSLFTHKYIAMVGDICDRDMKTYVRISVENRSADKRKECVNPKESLDPKE